MSDENKAVSRAEHKSLEKIVESLAATMSLFKEGVTEEMRLQREDVKKDIKETNDNIEKLAKTTNDNITRLYDRREFDLKERGKIPYPMLTLIFSVIVVLGSALAWNMTRIESTSNERDKALAKESKDCMVQRATLMERVAWINETQKAEVKKREALDTLTQYEFGRLSALRQWYQDDIADLDGTRDSHRAELLRLSSQLSALEENTKDNARYIREVDYKGSRRWVEERKRPDTSTSTGSDE